MFSKFLKITDSVLYFPNFSMDVTSTSINGQFTWHTLLAQYWHNFLAVINCKLQLHYLFIIIKLIFF